MSCCVFFARRSFRNSMKITEEAQKVYCVSYLINRISEQLEGRFFIEDRVTRVFVSHDFHRFPEFARNRYANNNIRDLNNR